MSRSARTLAWAGALPLAGCAPVASVLDPQGDSAAHISWIFWLFTGICALVWLVVMFALLSRLGARNAPAAPLPLDPRRETSYARIVGAAVGATAAVIIGLTIVSFFVDRSLARIGGKAPRVAIEITGRQWWWEARYLDPRPDHIFAVANEIHVPAGELVELRLRSADVIHSFWVPSLAGKEDLIPGQDNVLRIMARRPGVYRGQCAEFCGRQHAHMAVLVIAEPREDFERWRDGQLRPAEPPRGAAGQAGEKLFASRACVACHQLRGTTAAATVGPDLTHLASRRTIAAGAAPMTRGHLAAWIVDPQTMKPGAKMPAMGLRPAELIELVDYLEGLR